MNAPLLDAKINNYKKKIDKLDSLAGRLSDSEYRKYKAARRRFTLRLEAWRRTLGSDLALFNNNVAEGYSELEARLIKNKFVR